MRTDGLKRERGKRHNRPERIGPEWVSVVMRERNNSQVRQDRLRWRHGRNHEKVEEEKWRGQGGRMAPGGQRQDTGQLEEGMTKKNTQRTGDSLLPACR